MTTEKNNQLNTSEIFPIILMYMKYARGPMNLEISGIVHYHEYFMLYIQNKKKSFTGLKMRIY